MIHMRKTQAIYTELAIARESFTITCVLAETQRQAEEWEMFTGKKKGTAQVCPDWRLLAWGGQR